MRIVAAVNLAALVSW